MKISGGTQQGELSWQEFTNLRNKFRRIYGWPIVLLIAALIFMVFALWVLAIGVPNFEFGQVLQVLVLIGFALVMMTIAWILSARRQRLQDRIEAYAKWALEPFLVHYRVKSARSSPLRPWELTMAIGSRWVKFDCAYPDGGRFSLIHEHLEAEKKAQVHLWHSLIQLMLYAAQLDKVAKKGPDQVIGTALLEEELSVEAIRRLDVMLDEEPNDQTPEES